LQKTIINLWSNDVVVVRRLDKAYLELKKKQTPEGSRFDNLNAKLSLRRVGTRALKRFLAGEVIVCMKTTTLRRCLDCLE
jgi:hypothetical protein